LSLFELLKINYRLHILDLQREIGNDRIITAEMGLISDETGMAYFERLSQNRTQKTVKTDTTQDSRDYND